MQLQSFGYLRNRCFHVPDVPHCIRKKAKKKSKFDENYAFYVAAAHDGRIKEESNKQNRTAHCENQLQMLCGSQFMTTSH